jgi:hypothetical protein
MAVSNKGIPMREFVAHVVLPNNGGTQAVTVKEYDRDRVIAKLIRMGYVAVNGISG